MLLGALGLTAALAAPDPYEIYARARARWASQQYPRYLTYLVRISGDTPRGLVANTYTSIADTATNDIHVHATSAQEAAHAYVPHGINVNFNLTLSYSRHTQHRDPSAGDVSLAKTIHATEREQVDLLGVPQLTPAYSFGLAPDRPSSNAPNVSQLPAFKTIAAVTATRRDYDIRYAGLEIIDGAACYHLHLAPRRNPARFRLRDLWIDDASFVTHQAEVQGNFTAGPGPALPWLIRFSVADDLMYLSSETALAPVNYLGRTYSNVTVAFEQVRATDAMGSLWSVSLFRTTGDVLKEPR